MFFMNTGDLCREDGMARTYLLMNSETAGCPVRFAIGNHDMIKQGHGENVFEAYYGPTWYSFDCGKIHFVVLSIGLGDASSAYTKQERTEWLKKDLELADKDKRVRYISFSRNFGKEAGIYAGLQHAAGEYISIIDADLQQRPEVVLEMLSEMEKDDSLDCVAAYQEKRNEGKFISFLKSSFYKLINRISDVRFVNGASDFRLMKRQMVDAIISLTEYHRFTKGIFGYVGFKTKFIPFTHEKREIGTTKWGLVKLFKYAFHGILAFSTAPLKIPMVAGVISLLAAAIITVVAAV